MKTWDVFLSHNSKDKPQVRELALLLKERGLRVWLDEWELAPGRPWQQALEGMVDQVKSVAVLVGSEGIGPWQEAETRAFLSEFVSRGLPVIPVLLPKAPSRIDLPIFLKAFTWVDIREGVSRDALERLIWGITGTRSTPGHLVSERPGEGPAYSPNLVRPKLEDVFKTVGLPTYTYIEPTIYRRFAHALETPGKHLMLEGASGVGKTCLVFRALRELDHHPKEDFEYISARDQTGADRVALLIEESASERMPKIVVIDDVHMLDGKTRSRLANRLKVMSDMVFLEEAPTKFVLVGIPMASAGLLYDAVDLGPRAGTFRLGKATERQLKTLIGEGEERLAVRFRDPDVIIGESSGSFYLCQYICHEICFNEGVLEAQQDVKVLRYRIDDVRVDLLAELHDRYGQHVLRFCKGRRWKIEQVSGFTALLASIARRGKSIVNLNEILLDAGPYEELVAGAVEALAEPGGAGTEDSSLSRLLHYDGVIQTFSIEDPAFRYYLTNLEIGEVLASLGIEDEAFQAYYSRKLEILREGLTEPKARRDIEAIRDSVFVSYSHADSEWMERLRVHMTPLVRAGVVSLWSDTQIRAGTAWLEEIDRAIDAAQVAVLLVSANYLASDFVAAQELPILLARARDRGLRIIWVPVSPCLWEATAIRNYQSVIDPRKTLQELSRPEQEKALVAISKAIRGALEQEGGSGV